MSIANGYFGKVTQSQQSLTTLAKIGSLSSRTGILLKNLGPDTLYVGGSDVATSDGFPVPANEDLFINGPLPVWGISAGTSDVRALELE